MNCVEIRERPVLEVCQCRAIVRDSVHCIARNGNVGAQRCWRSDGDGDMAKMKIKNASLNALTFTYYTP